MYGRDMYGRDMYGRDIYDINAYIKPIYGRRHSKYLDHFAMLDPIRIADSYIRNSYLGNSVHLPPSAEEVAKQVLKKREQNFQVKLVEGSVDDLKLIRNDLTSLLGFLNAKIDMLERCSVCVDELSKDVLLLIFRQLTNDDLSKVKDVCQKWYKIIEHNLSLFTFSKKFKQIQLEWESIHLARIPSPVCSRIDRFVMEREPEIPIHLDMSPVFQSDDAALIRFHFMLYHPKPCYIKEFVELLQTSIGSQTKFTFSRKEENSDVFVDPTHYKLTHDSFGKLTAKLYISNFPVHGSVNQVNLSTIDLMDSPVTFVKIYDSSGTRPIYIDLNRDVEKSMKTKVI